MIERSLNGAFSYNEIVAFCLVNNKHRINTIEYNDNCQIQYHTNTKTYIKRSIRNPSFDQRALRNHFRVSGIYLHIGVGYHRHFYTKQKPLKR